MKNINIFTMKNDREKPYISICVDDSTASSIRKAFIKQANEAMSLAEYKKAQTYITAANDLEKAMNELQKLKEGK